MKIISERADVRQLVLYETCPKLNLFKYKYTTIVHPHTMKTGYQRAKQYATQLAESLTRVELEEFFKEIHDNYYPHIDVSFMKHFLKLAEHEGEFLVPHTKLKEYGIMTSTESSDVRKKMDRYDLVNGEDYILGDVSENSKPGPGAPSKTYILTPDAFKTCLMRAQYRASYETNPIIYIRYYLLLEKIFKLYRDYQNDYNKKLHSMKDDNINRLENTVNKQSEKIDEQAKRIDMLLKYAKDTKEELVEVHEELTETKEDLTEAKDDLNEAKVEIIEMHDELTEVHEDLKEAKQDIVVVKDHLAKKSLVSTKKTKSPSLHSHFAATTYSMDDGTQFLKFTTGTLSYVKKTIKKLVAKEENTIIIQPFYNANPLDLRHNCQDVFGKFKKQRIAEIRLANTNADLVHNLKLRAEISAYNKNHPGNKRSYLLEKRKTPNVNSGDINIKFQAREVKYHPNPYITFAEVVDIVVDTNKTTQTSPA